MTIKKLEWQEFKTQVDNLNLNMQCLDINLGYYEIFAYYNKFTLFCRILKTTPKSVDQLDWEDNYQNTSNELIKNQVLVQPADIAITLYRAPDICTIAAGQEETIDLFLEQEGSELQHILYGGAVHALNPGFEDYVRFQVVDINNVLGYGAGLVLKEYIKKAYLNNNNTFEDYDDAGAYLPVGLALRCIYKSTKESGETKVKINYLLGVPF